MPNFRDFGSIVLVCSTVAGIYVFAKIARMRM